jgi:hypothetical protein
MPETKLLTKSNAIKGISSLSENRNNSHPQEKPSMRKHSVLRGLASKTCGRWLMLAAAAAIT